DEPTRPRIDVIAAPVQQSAHCQNRGREGGLGQVPAMAFAEQCGEALARRVQILLQRVDTGIALRVTQLLLKLGHRAGKSGDFVGAGCSLLDGDGAVHAASRLALRAAKVSPVSASRASAPVNDCQRSMATST